LFNNTTAYSIPYSDCIRPMETLSLLTEEDKTIFLNYLEQILLQQQSNTPPTFDDPCGGSFIFDDPNVFSSSVTTPIVATPSPAISRSPSPTSSQPSTYSPAPYSSSCGLSTSSCSVASTRSGSSSPPAANGSSSVMMCLASVLEALSSYDEGTIFSVRKINKRMLLNPKP
jgi:hypothetical protein